MKKIILFFILFFCFFHNLNAQRYLIKLKDKGFSPYTLANSSQYLSQRAIDRRIRFSIPIDSTDLPVSPRYLDSIRAVPGVTILNASRWLNMVSVTITDGAALAKINSFPFVTASSHIANRLRTNENFPAKEWETLRTQVPPSSSQRISTDYYSYGNSYAQIHVHNGEFLHNIGLRGQNMIIGMLDAGFQNYTTVTGFDSARNNGQILGTWDFVSGHSSVAEDHSHGEECFSIMAGNIPGTYVGTAPKANYYLFRTEDVFSEYPIEEHNWVCAAERLDSAGGDLISSSLGYRTFDDPSMNYTYADMNGNTTMAAIGADLAAKKGIFVVAAAGNDGVNGWHYIITPADGDSVMAVGGVNTNLEIWPSSAYGPSSDGQIKPDVASVGSWTIVQYSNNAVGGGFGTSYACPNMAGLTTCLMQGFPEFNNIKLLKAIRQAGNNVATPNDRIGYGVPDMRKAVMSLIKEFATSAISVANCKNTLTWTSKDVAAMHYEIERKAPEENSFKKIAERNGTGTIFSNHTYQYTDTLPNATAGIISYRIKQVIDTTAAGYTAAYIDSAMVEVNSSCESEDYVSISPNPAPKNHFVLQVNFPHAIEKLMIIITDMQGRTVDIIRKSKSDGSAKFNIPIPQLSGGNYFVSVYDNIQLLATKTLIKL